MERRDPDSPPELPPLPEGPFLLVSYASVNRARVLEIADALRAAGVELWIDQAGIAGGAAYGTEIAYALKACSAVALMCSEASLASRNVRQEIMLAWRYNRPILPLLLEPTTFPDDVAYWLEGAQWIEVLDRPSDAWLPAVARALSRHGISLATPEEAIRSESIDLPIDIAGNLPPAGDPLIGRERETRELLALIGSGRWITLIGPGGIGKTRLALDAARRIAVDLPGGAWFVDLAPVSDPDHALPAVAAALDIAEEPGAAWLDLVAARIGDEELLLVLDNLEQIPAAAQSLDELTGRCPNLTVLATSRTPLRTGGEWVYQVEPFPLPDPVALPPLPVLAQNPAVRLFVERARAARPDFVLTDGLARPVAEICQRLDGLPLAIELAAARVRMLTPAAIVTRLGSRLNLLTRGTAANTRQQTLRDTIAWSYGLLSPDEQATFRRLAIFSGGATVEAAEAVIQASAGTGGDHLDEIAALADHSLLRVESRSATDAPRVRMLETIRELATEFLDASGEREAVAAAHARYMLTLAEAHDASLRNPRPDSALATLRAEDDNIRAALDWLSQHPPADDPDAELRLAAALAIYWRRIGRYLEAAERLDQALDRAPAADPATRARALHGAGFIAGRRGDTQTAVARFEEALALWRASRDRVGEADTLQELTFQLIEHGGDYDRVVPLLEEALAIRKELGDQIGAATALHDLGAVAIYQGDYPIAIARLSEAIPVFRRAADARNLAVALTFLSGAEMLSGQGDPVRHAEESLALWRTIDDRYAVTRALLNHGRALQHAGRYAEAIPLLREGRAECAELGDRNGVSLGDYGLGLIALAAGDDLEAFNRLSESLRISAELDQQWHVAERLEALAELRIARSDPGQAARFIGAAAALRDAGGFPVPASLRDALDRATAAARTALGDAAFDDALTAGRTAPLTAVIAEALAGEV